MAATGRVELAAYRTEMHLVKSAWKLGCSNQLGEYHRDLEASRATMVAYRAYLESHEGVLVLPTSAKPPTLNVPPSTHEIERCFRNLVEHKSSQAAKRAAASIQQAVAIALSDIQAVRCVPVKFPDVVHPDDLELRPRVPCHAMADEEKTGADTAAEEYISIIGMLPKAGLDRLAHLVDQVEQRLNEKATVKDAETIAESLESVRKLLDCLSEATAKMKANADRAVGFVSEGRRFLSGRKDSYEAMCRAIKDTVGAATLPSIRGGDE